MANIPGTNGSDTLTGTILADTIDGTLMHLAARDVTFTAVSRAPLAEIRRFIEGMAATRRVIRRNKKAATPGGVAAPGPRLRSRLPLRCARRQTPSSARRGRLGIHMRHVFGAAFTAGSVPHGRASRNP